MTNTFTAKEFAKNGARLLKGAILPCINDLKAAIGGYSKEQAGVRLHGIRALGPLLDINGTIGAIAGKALGKSARPVRAILFNMSADTNWSLAWHQDRTVCVKERREAPGFGPWTVKSGLNHVAPPFDLLTRMVTLRVHATPILHASEAASEPMSRRVLQVDFAADDLPYGLEWLGV